MEMEDHTLVVLGLFPSKTPKLTPENACSLRLIHFCCRCFGPEKSRATNMQIDNTIHMFCFFFVLNLCQQLKKMKQQDPRDGDGEILMV